MEHWHPNPDFFFKPGGGPVLDIGPYYITNLINLIGPVKRVAALSLDGRARRAVISSEPRARREVKVETPTNIHALLEFESGATVTLVGQLGRLRPPARRTWSFMAPRARCSCRTRTSSAARF